MAGGPARPWEALGFVHTTIDGQTVVPLAGTSIVLDGGAPGLSMLLVSGIAGTTGIDGVAARCVEPTSPTMVVHPIGAAGIDHVVIGTDSLDRTCAAVTDVTGAPLKRVRSAGPVRQGFHRLGALIVEVVEQAGVRGPASLWGIAINVDDLDRAVASGGGLVGPAKDAVQPGRRIATVRSEAGLGLAVALMSPE